MHDGERFVDIAIATDPAHVPPRVRALRRAVLRAETMAEQGLLMTMPAPAPVQQWRDWVEAEMVEQAVAGREPVSYAEHLSAVRLRRRPPSPERPARRRGGSADAGASGRSVDSR